LRKLLYPSKRRKADLVAILKEDDQKVEEGTGLEVVDEVPPTETAVVHLFGR
jgi:hypothetical protein